MTIEDDAGGPELPIHAGGQGVWQARMLRTFGRSVSMCVALTGETGRVVRHLLENEGVVPGDVYRRLAADLGAAGTSPIVDLSGARLAAALEGGVRLVKVSDEELRASGDAGDGSVPELVAAARRIRDAGAGSVVVSRAGTATLLIDGGFALAESVPVMEAVDSLGAGDSFTAAYAEGLDVVVAAPASEASGSSASITGAEASGRIRMERRRIEGLDVPCHAVRAAPALIALIAAHGAFGTVPDLVLSGVNRGANIGRAILHSGTVGAALTGGANGARSLAVSLDVGTHPESPEWEAAARLTRTLLRSLIGCSAGTVLNLNVPNHPDAPGRPVREATLAPFGIVQTTAAEAGEGEIRLTVADLEGGHEPHSDAALLAGGHPTITSITGIGEAPLPEGFATVDG